MKKVAVAMSGGIDSGVAAALMVKAGYQVAGFYMKLWREQGENKAAQKAAEKTAQKLGIPFYLVDLEAAFKKQVVDYFLKAYSQGLTPNPCVMCNRFIKFDEPLKYIQKQGYDYLATGHYARIKNNSLLMGKDKTKDQSYFLYNFTPKQLPQVIFPVGVYTKRRVRALAKRWQLPVAERPESQEICFFSETDYRPFLKRQLKGKIIPGEVVDLQGKVIGRHEGIPLYTIGQRHGFQITDKKAFGPFYVISKEAKKNKLVVGFGKEVERNSFGLREINWLDEKAQIRAQKPAGLSCRVRIRYQGELLKARIQDKIVVLAESERGVAPGQAAVFYQGEKVLGGGLMAVDKE
jgi:tRNA-specific 2-thiouridylase